MVVRLDAMTNYLGCNLPLEKQPWGILPNQRFYVADSWDGSDERECAAASDVEGSGIETDESMGRLIATRPHLHLRPEGRTKVEKVIYG